jgi:hypothetical protein
MVRDGRRLLEHFAFQNVNSLAASIALKKSGTLGLLGDYLR